MIHVVPDMQQQAGLVKALKTLYQREFIQLR